MVKYLKGKFMRANVREEVQIAYRTEGTNGNVETVAITLTEEDVNNIKKAHVIVKENPFIQSLSVNKRAGIELLDEEGEEDEEFDLGVDFFKVYGDVFYYFAQGNYDSRDQFESNPITLD